VKALKGKVPPAGSTGSQFNDRVKWLKYQKLVDKLFGIQVQADVDTQPGDVPRKLDQLVAVFDSISGPADTTSNPPPAKAQDKKRLFCGDGNWLYIDPKGEYKDLLTDSKCHPLIQYKHYLLIRVSQRRLAYSWYWSRGHQPRRQNCSRSLACQSLP
jgi:hypothetical protein